MLQAPDTVCGVHRAVARPGSDLILRHFKVLGQLDTYGAAVVVPALTVALATGIPLLLALPAARSAPRLAPDAMPALLRAIDVASGCAAADDGWLLGGAA